jgi:hypothetical protein
MSEHISRWFDYNAYILFPLQVLGLLVLVLTLTPLTKGFRKANRAGKGHTHNRRWTKWK